MRWVVWCECVRDIACLGAKHSLVSHEVWKRLLGALRLARSIFFCRPFFKVRSACRCDATVVWAMCDIWFILCGGAKLSPLSGKHILFLVR